MQFGIFIREWWQWSYAQGLSFLYFHKVALVGEETVPDGPVLFLGTHRNGILDALVYSNVLGRMTFVMAKRLHKSFAGRLFFGGIGVIREKDEAPNGNSARDGNRQALKECRNYLVRGHRIFMFPEGSSSLGPRLLDIKPGATKIALSALRVRPDLKVVPVAVSYERAWGFRSRAEVRLGAPINLKDIHLHPKSEGFALARERIEEGLHKVACEFETDVAQEASEVAANVRRLAGFGSHFDNVTTCESDASARLEETWQSLKQASENVGASRYNRIPLVPDRSLHSHILKLIGLGPFVAFMLVANMPILLGARYAARKLAKGQNVISLFRLFVGLPLMLVWGSLTLAALALVGLPELWMISLSISLIGLGAYDAVKKSWTVVMNRRKSNAFRAAFNAFVRAALVNPVLT